MSTDGQTRRSRSRKRRGRSFVLAFAGVVAALAVGGFAGAAATTAQGPRVTDVQVDPAAAVAASGARLIVTTSQALRDVAADQVSIEPATPFVVDTSGRSIGVRFALPLWDDTEYTVTIADVEGVGGGPAATITQTFRTDPARFHLLQRGADQDTIFRTDLMGRQAIPVFRHAHIEDFRATSSHLVVSVREDSDRDSAAAGAAGGRAELIVTDLDGEDRRTLPLPGDGTVTNLQSADRGDLIGYTFTDADISEAGGRDSMLFTMSLKDPDAEPQPVEVSGTDDRVLQWRFVPGTDRVLFVGFDSTLWLTGPPEAPATPLGNAVALADVSGSTALVERPDALVALNLTDGSEEPLVAPAEEPGQLRSVVAVPGGGTIRLYAALDESGLPSRSVVASVDADGTTTVLSRWPSTDSVIRMCVSPSGRYAATVVAPDIVDNPYDGYLLPMPERVETHIVEIATGDEIVALTGFDSSWCRVPPQ
ncbi:hypothetical protein ACH3VR_20670 [Microbacterium sp. B2969]|uniref:SbsA Ig-like domain-containing protein n=1 Tax=Microbacterium alkaliflavum TaxID=3248839 RepID=A0ABW7QD31_9MICO